MEEMCVKRVVDRRLEVEFEGLLYRSGDVSKEVGCHEDLMRLDSNGDGVLEVGDLVGSSKYLPKEPLNCALQTVVSKAFADAGVIARNAEEAVKHLFKLYNRVERIYDIVIGGIKDPIEGVSIPSWRMMHSDTWGRELEFDDHSYWKAHVEPHVTGRGILTNYFDYERGVRYSFEVFMQGRESITGFGLGYQLAEEMRMVLDDLAGLEKVKLKEGLIKGSTTVYRIEGKDLPKVVRSQAEHMIDRYNDIINFLNEYREVECDGKGCGIGDEYGIYRFTNIVNASPAEPEEVAKPAKSDGGG